MNYTDSTRTRSKSSWYQPFLAFGAAALAYVGISGTPAQAEAKPASSRSSYAIRAKSLEAFVSPQEKGLSAQEAGDEPASEPQEDKRPASQLNEKELAQRAEKFYLTAITWPKDKPKDAPERLAMFLEAYRLHALAEAKTPGTQYELPLAQARQQYSLALNGKYADELDAAGAKALDEKINAYIALKTAEENPQPQQPAQPTQPQPAPQQPAQPQNPQPVPQQPQPQQPVPPQPRQEQPKTTPDGQLVNPYGIDRIGIHAVVGAEKSSQDRGASLDARVGGLSLIATAHSDKFREAVSTDPVREKGYGAFIEADADSLLGVPLKLSLDIDTQTHTRKSSDFSETDDAQFNIKTFTDINEARDDDYLAGALELKLGSSTLRVVGYKGAQKVKTDVMTRVELINKTDPAGNYTQLIPTSVSVDSDTIGGQFMFLYELSPETDLGVLVSAETTDIKSLNRSIDRVRWHALFDYLADDRTRGMRVVLGEGILNDQGEENDQFTKFECSIVGGVQVSPHMTLAANFRYFDNPAGSVMFLLGESDNALEHIINAASMENMGALDLLKHMGGAQQKVYLLGRHEDLIAALAQQNKFLIYGNVGAARVQMLTNTKTVAQGSLAALLPVTKDVTISGEGFVNYADLVKEYGLRLGAHPTDSRWDFFMEVAREITEGRLENKEDFRAFVGARYSLDKRAKK